MSERTEPERSEQDETQLLRRALEETAHRHEPERLRPQAMIEVYDVGGNLERIVSIPPEGLSIGRGEDQDLRLDDRTVSRRHARIDFHDGVWWLDDAGSLNDTLLNQELVRGRARLSDGDRLTIGLHLLIVTVR